MSRNGYEDEGRMGEENDASSQESDALEATPAPSISPKPRSRARKSVTSVASVTPKAPKASAKSQTGERTNAKKASRKSVAPKSRRASLTPSQPAARNGAKTVTFAPGENPAAKFQRDEDDISIPPASGDLDEHEQFFAEGARVGARSEPPPRVVAGRAHSSDVASRPLGPVVPLARRQRLANVVKGAVAVSGFLCLAALVRVGLGHRGSEHIASAAGAQIVSVAPAAKVTEAAPVAVAGDPAPAAEDTSEPTAPLKAASEEREDARHALELGKTQDAVDAAKRSITVDPTDAEAWLILGAALQAQGHAAEAHDAFNECTKQAKTGNVYECGAMLRWNGPR